MYRFKTLFSPTPLKLFRSRNKVLPPELSTNVLRLTCDSATKTGVSDVYVIGTIHEHPKCIEDVRAVVKFLRPQAVFLEMCSDRVCLSEIDKVSSKYKIKVNIEFENEFQAAIDEAYECGANIILGDRHLQITRRRYVDKFVRMSFLHIMKIILSKWRLIFSEPPMHADDLYKMTTTSTAELKCKYCGPIFKEICLDERDQYMSAMLLKVARKHNLVVAVVGKSHLLGIQKYWKQPIEVEQLLSAPLEMEFFSSRVKLAFAPYFFPFF